MSTWLQSLTHGSNGGPGSAVAAILSVYSGNEEVRSETKGAGVDRSVIPRCTFNLYGQPAVALTNLGTGSPLSDVGFPQRLLVGFGRLNFAEDGEQRKALDETENYMQYIAIAVAMRGLVTPGQWDDREDADEIAKKFGATASDPLNEEEEGYKACCMQQFVSSSYGLETSRAMETAQAVSKLNAKSAFARKAAAAAGKDPNRSYEVDYVETGLEDDGVKPNLSASFLAAGVYPLMLEFEVGSDAEATMKGYLDSLHAPKKKVTPSTTPTPTENAKEQARSKQGGKALRLAGSLAILELAEDDVDRFLKDKTGCTVSGMSAQKEFALQLARTVCAEMEAKAHENKGAQTLGFGRDMESRVPEGSITNISASAVRKAIVASNYFQKGLDALLDPMHCLEGSTGKKSESAGASTLEAKVPTSRLSRLVQEMSNKTFILGHVKHVTTLKLRNSKVPGGVDVLSELPVLRDLQEKYSSFKVLVRSGSQNQFYILKTDYGSAPLEEKQRAAQALLECGVSWDTFQANRVVGKDDTELSNLGPPMTRTLPFGLKVDENSRPAPRKGP